MESSETPIPFISSIVIGGLKMEPVALSIFNKEGDGHKYPVCFRSVLVVLFMFFGLVNGSKTKFLEFLDNDLFLVS